MRTDQVIREEMKLAREDMVDLLQAAVFRVKGNNSIYNKVIDELEK